MIVDSIDAGGILVFEARAHHTGSDRVAEDLLEQGRRAARRPGTPRSWWAVSSWWQNSAMTGVGLFFDARRWERAGTSGSTRRRSGAAARRRARGGDLLLQAVGRRADRLVEEGQEQLVLAGEVLVEAPQGLARTLHHLLHGEVPAGLGARQQLEPGIEEALHPVLAPHPGRVERPGDGKIPTADRSVGLAEAGAAVSRAPSAQFTGLQPFESGTLPVLRSGIEENSDNGTLSRSTATSAGRASVDRRLEWRISRTLLSFENAGVRHRTVRG